jgi:hypothetical protein
MRRFFVFLLVGALPLVASAQEQAGGQYVSFNLVAETNELPGGRTVLHGTYGQFMTTEDGSGALANMMGECYGSLYLSPSGTTESGAGFCFFRDPEGNGYWAWWRVEEGGTTRCPISCGLIGVVGGVGSLEGMTGEGTFKNEVGYPDLTGVGSWTLSWQKE